MFTGNRHIKISNIQVCCVDVFFFCNHWIFRWAVNNDILMYSLYVHGLIFCRLFEFSNTKLWIESIAYCLLNVVFREFAAKETSNEA